MCSNKKESETLLLTIYNFLDGKNILIFEVSKRRKSFAWSLIHLPQKGIVIKI